MKYKTMPEEVDIVKYEFGMEDGFKSTRSNQYIPIANEFTPENYMSKKYPRYHIAHEVYLDEILDNSIVSDWKPYIGDYAGSHCLLVDAPYIVTHEDKTKECVSEFELNSRFIATE